MIIKIIIGKVAEFLIQSVFKHFKRNELKKKLERTRQKIIKLREKYINKPVTEEEAHEIIDIIDDLDDEL